MMMVEVIYLEIRSLLFSGSLLDVENQSKSQNNKADCHACSSSIQLKVEAPYHLKSCIIQYLKFI
jgi:hypothetical protein